MNSIVLAKAEITDAEGLAVLFEQLIEKPSDIDKLKQRLEEISQNPHYLLAVAREDDIPVGTAMGVLCLDPCADCRPFVIIENVVVSAHCRGKQIGNKLMRYIEDWACGHQAAYTQLVSSAYRREAHRFYEKLGYAREGGFRKKFF